MKIILGSRSPRRKELLAMLGYDFLVQVSEVDENVSADSYQEMVQNIAMKKANAIKNNNQEALVICADTIVVCNNEVMGKPKDINDARRMIKLLQDNVHKVYTSVVCIYQDEVRQFTEGTKVYVIHISDDEIEQYINTDEPYDKAGAYAIQGTFAKYIERIEGDYYNVMGLPICRLNKVLKDMIK